MEWMFLSCHNYWIVCRLVRRDGGEPFLAYSPFSSIENSSELFRAYLGAVLSVQNDVPVETSAFNLEMKLDDISEEMDHRPFPEGDMTLIIGGSGACSSTNDSSMVPTTCPSAITSGHTDEPGLMVCPIRGRFLVSWLTRLLADYFLLPALP
jgi:hypothetical protein